MKTENGNSIITIPIVVAVGIMFLSTIIVLCVNIIMPYIWYEKLSSTCIKYVFVMEEYGYLTKKEKNNMLDELVEQGFESKNIKIDVTEKKQSYGEPIFLNVNYKYHLELPYVKSKDITMNIKRQSVSKR